MIEITRQDLISQTEAYFGSTGTRIPERTRDYLEGQEYSGNLTAEQKQESRQQEEQLATIVSQ